MLTEQHELLTARFTNDERTTIEAQWFLPPEGAVETIETELEVIEAIEGDFAYEHLLKHITVDELHENTFKFMKEQLEILDEVALHVGKERGMIYDVDNVNSNLYSVIIKMLLKDVDEEEGGKETLFLYKLNIFENEVISKSKNRTLKSKIRKAKSMREATVYAIELYDKEVAKSSTTQNT